MTDGDPDQIDRQTATYQEALDMIEAHCYSHVPIDRFIVPFVIGVGDKVDTETLAAYSQYFLRGFLHVKGNESSMAEQFEEIFDLVLQSALKSFDPNRTADDIVRTIKDDMEERLERFLAACNAE